MNTGRYIKSFPFEFVFDFLWFNVVSFGFRKRVIIDNLHIYSGETQVDGDEKGGLCCCVWSTGPARLGCFYQLTLHRMPKKKQALAINSQERQKPVCWFPSGNLAFGYLERHREV